jgi:nucleoside-diphosphate-sugar epimerase
LAQLAKEAGVGRFIYASSCSVYFTYDIVEDPEPKNEEADINPISTYSISKRASELTLQDLEDDDFEVVIFRPGTHYGWSPRLRLDLVVNTMTKSAFFDNEIQYLEDIYRPLVDVDSMAKIYEEGLTCKPGIYNAFDFNTSLADLAQMIADIIPIEVEIKSNKVDVERNYKARSEKLKEFAVCPRPFEEAVLELWTYLQSHPEDKDIYYNKNV